MTAVVDVPALRAKLADLEERLVAHRVVLPPGLDGEALRALAGEWGFELPIEVAELYKWHDGFGNWVTPIPSAPTSLATALARSRTRRLEVLEGARAGQDWNPDELWPESWLDLGSGGGIGLVIDCAQPTHEPTRVLNPDWTATDDLSRLPVGYPQVVARSLTEVVRTWLHLFEIGVYGTGGRGELPDELRLKRIY